MHKQFASIVGFIIACFVGSICCAQVTESVTLNGLPMDSFLSSVTDPGTGVSFTNSTSLDHDFVITYFNATASLPDTTPGIILSANGYANNGGIDVPGNFGFTMTLPIPSSSVSMIANYVSLGLQGYTGSLLLQGFNSSNTLVASDGVTPPTSYSTVEEQPLSISSGSNNIVTVTMTASSISDNFGAINFSTVPEPGTLSLFAAAGVRLLLSRRSYSALRVARRG